MKSENLKYLATLLANFAVFAGLIFLTLEMRQTSAIATAQVRMEYAAAWRTIDSARQDSTFAQLINKSLVDPENLSVSEVIQLDAYYWGIVDQMISAQTGSDTGVRLTSFEHMVTFTVSLYFTNRFAQNWWEQARKGFEGPLDSEFRNVIDDAISGIKGAGNTNPYAELHRKLTSQVSAQ